MTFLKSSIVIPRVFENVMNAKKGLTRNERDEILSPSNIPKATPVTVRYGMNAAQNLSILVQIFKKLIKNAPLSDYTPKEGENE